MKHKNLLVLMAIGMSRILYPSNAGLSNFNSEDNKNIERIIQEEYSRKSYEALYWSAKNEYAQKHIEKEIQKKYSKFEYQNEISQILKHAKMVGIEPELLMAIRLAENGKNSLAYGIMPSGKAAKKYKEDKGYFLEEKFYPYEDEKEKQLCWASWTVKKNFERFKKNAENHEDFLSYLASKYAPMGVANDPNELNSNWEKNVRHFYGEFKNFNLYTKTCQFVF